MVDVEHFILGAVVLWAPGLTWTLALAPGLDVPKTLFASIIVALSVPPAVMFILTVFFGVRLAPVNTALLALTLASLGLGWYLAPRLDRALA